MTGKNYFLLLRTFIFVCHFDEQSEEKSLNKKRLIIDIAKPAALKMQALAYNKVGTEQCSVPTEY